MFSLCSIYLSFLFQFSFQTLTFEPSMEQSSKSNLIIVFFMNNDANFLIKTGTAIHTGAPQFTTCLNGFNLNKSSSQTINEETR